MKKTILIFCLGVFLGSCQDFLKETPYDFVSPENLQTSPAGVKQMVTGMYSVFFNAQMFHNESWIYLTFSDDEWTNGVEWAMGTYGVGNFKGGWIYNNSGNDPYYVFYRLVRAANAVLEVLPKVEFNQADNLLKNQYEGEALTLRALSYFYLVQMYGPVPLHLKTDDPSTMPRNSVSDVYNQILDDLHKAEQKLYLNSKRPSSIKRGHVTKGAAQLLLAKVYSTMGSGSLTSGDVTVPMTLKRLPNKTIEKKVQTFSKNKVEGYDFDPLVAYDSARTVAKRLMATNEYQMMRYANTWNPVNFGGNEFVFALETDSLYTSATTTFNKFVTPVGLKGQGWLTYAKDLYYLYDSLDERRLYGISHEFRSSNKMSNGIYKRQYFPPEDSMYYRNKYGATNVITSLTSNMCYLMKHYTGNSMTPQVLLNESEVGIIVTNPTQNFPLLRYTEAYLILAEAENEISGPTSSAYDALDIVRKNRLSTNNYGIDRSMNQQQLRSYILEERTREFIGEGYRRFDLIRWGIYLDVMNAVDSRVPYFNSQSGIISKRREQKHLLYPIPTIEIDGNTAFGPNNPGW